ncbi:hypothetical protein AWC38_SpisGene8244 [Stylophora pistillata]|uniref:Uncharacterized protein n=1 Tax=Stylophora pistillata TaxID=50429 RepID=A0A2B4SDF2_STYPI|nr:hypothetical protein AWC38_SpisGene8244 [Stylophora pistillata]
MYSPSVSSEEEERMFTSDEDDENNNLNEEQEEILNEHIEYHEEMKSLMENVLEVAQRRGIEAARSLPKDKPKKPERTVESLFSVEKAGPTEAQTNAYLESRRPNSTQPSAGRLPAVVAIPETWEAAATCIKVVNATIDRSQLLEKRVGLVSERIGPNFEKKMSNALKADRVIHRVTFNPNSASPGEVLRVPVPKLDNGVVLVPGSLALVFHLTVSGPANNFLVNNVARALVDRLTLKFAGEILQDTDGYDLFKLWDDLFLTENERANMFREGIQSEDLSKIRCNAGDKKTSGVNNENKLNEVYRNIYRIPLDHDILKDHGVFFPRALSDELLFELRLAPADSVVKGSDSTKLYYKLTNIQLEYEVIHSQKLADEALSNYKNGKRFMYEHITHLKTISIDKGSDTIINESINVPRRSMKGLLLLFYGTYTAGTRISEKTFKPNITDVKLTVDGIPNNIYSQGM